MNRIYKVIWNKTRGMYMVVSELAKGQSKDGRRAVGRKKVAQTAAALAVFFSIVSMGGTTFAADTTKVESSTSDTAVEVYTKDGTDAQIKAANQYTYRKTAELDQKLTDQKTSTALHISSTGDLIVGIKENQTVKDMEIRGKLTSGSLSTGDITSTGDVTVTGKVAADGVTDETTKDGTYIKQNNTVGNNLVSLDKQVKANDDRITAVKEYLQKEAADTYVSKNDAAVQDGAVVKAANTIGDNVTKLDSALAKETAARLGADAAQDKVIQQVNENASQGIATLATAYQNEAAAREAKDNELNERITNEANEIHKTTNQLQTDLNKETADRKTADNELNERITNEANVIHETTKQLQTDLNTETTARETADAALDTRITNVKEYLEKQTSDNYVSKADAAVQDGAVVKAANTIGENVANLDAALDAEKNARIWADKTQDKVIQQVNQNMVDGFNTINKNMADGFTALNQADAKEAQERAAADAALDDKITAETSARVAADTKLVEAVNSGLSLSNDNVLQKNTTTIDAQGNVTTSKTDANKMILNKGRDNQITLNEKGIKVGTNSTVVDKDGVYTGGDTYSEAKAAMSADGKIKGANGDFTVDENGNVTSKATITGETVTDGKGASMSNGTVTGKTLTDGIATITNGNINTSGSITGGTVTSTGNISALGDIHAGGAITGASASIQGALTAGSATITGDLTAGGAIQGKSISDGTATMQNGNLTGVKNLSAETITTSGDATIGGDLTVKGKLNVDEIDLTKNGIVGDNNVTASTKVAAGEITSYKKATSTKDGSKKESAIDYDENGTSTWAEATDADGNWKKSTLTVEGSDVTSKVVDSDKNSNESIQTSQESSDVVKDANGNTSTFSQRVKDILQEIKNAAGDTLTKVEQTDTAITSQIGDGSAVKSEMTADGITNTAVGGTITNSAKDLVNTATGDMTNTVGGKMLNDVIGDMENKVGGNLTTTVGGSQNTTVTGDSSLTAENITNEARNKITNKALDVETDASSSIVSKVSNEYGSNTSTQLSYQTTEEMSQADGKKASYLRGAAEEKSQLTDGDKKTTIDTIAGQTNTNITDGTNTSNSLQKADQVASSVTDGTNTTVVNQDAKSLASSITDGTKANNTNSTVDKSEQLIKASDTRYSATTKTASKTEDALVSGGSFIDVIKSLDDAANPLISSAVTDGTNSTGITQTAKDITNTAKNGTIANDAKNITNTAAEKLSNKAADIENLASSSILNKVGDNVSSKLETDKITTVVKDGSKSNTVTETASASKQQMVSGNIIDILKDAETGYVNTTVKTSDKSSSTSVNQETENITSTAKQGTITNDAKNLVNKAAESITNTAGTQIQDVVGKSTVTITDTGTTFENTEHAAPIGEGSIKQTTISGNTLETGKATADYVDVNKDLHVMGNTKLDGTLEVAGKSTFKDDVTMDEDLDVKGTTTTDKLVVNNGANITGGTTTDTLHVTNTATFDGKVTFKDAVSMEKDLSVGGNATVTGDVTAKSYKVGDKTYINENGINANGQKITNVADGTIAEGSTDAVNGGQLNATNQRVTTVENRMDGVENRMDRVENRVDNLDNRIDKVGASAAAMANLHPMDFDEDSKVSVAAAMGSYRSETAGALGVFYRPTDRVMLNVSTSFGNGENMVGGGVSFKLGKSSKRLAKAEATNAALAKQVTNLQNRLDALLGVLNPSLSKDFPDVPANHWAYEAVSRLAGNDIVQGYEDGKYHGERTMTRYEMAEIIYNALSKGAKAEAKLVEEFRPELQAMAAQRKA
ncbi:ESPR-type extended signal peptide-containing protein [uncultured Acidaminococcus sp.]|uniref:ESPR-type extended signal peptide-containing protein n=1 Tax=uncultured Acidaminococcus sp. TaxID=352152 RepID=UPI0026DABE87|nr:ESPR-type extended signal peptide-containing protein [uncultured Acidaminococcus sp.]